VSRNNRVVERHPSRDGAYWKSFDFRTSKGAENLFHDPLDLHPTGGEMIFNLPNGLQGYFVATGAGARLEAAPTDIVTDKFAEDKTVRNGLACMRCHDRGVKEFADVVRPALLRLPGSPGFDKRAALNLYPEQAVLDGFLKEDGERFRAAMARVLGKEWVREPLVPVTRRFLDEPLLLTTAAGELGLVEPGGLRELFRAPQFAGLGLVPLAAQGAVRRDTWEDYFDQVVRGLGLGVPVVPLDGLSCRDFPAGPAPCDVELKTNKKHNTFEPGDELVLRVTNRSQRPLYIELFGTSARGRTVLLAPSTTTVGPGETYRYPAQGGIKIRGGLGKERITLFASAAAFPGGELLRGEGVSDRVLHPFFGCRREGGRWRLANDGTGLVKRVIEIETR
jgi:serine/threonine-protein kinase